MNSPFALPALLIFFTVVGLITILLSPEPLPSGRTADSAKPPAVGRGGEKNLHDDYSSNDEGHSAVAAVTTIPQPIASPMAVASVDVTTTKDQDLERIHDAMTTYSEEGLPVLKSYLTNSDTEIRMEAIEAIKQLAVPAGADVLLAAARGARTPEEADEMVDAAEFLKLPRLSVDEVKKLLKAGQLAPPIGSSALRAPEHLSDPHQ